MNLKELQTAKEAAQKSKNYLEARLDLLKKQQTDLEQQLSSFNITPDNVEEGLASLQQHIQQLVDKCQVLSKKLQDQLTPQPKK